MEGCIVWVASENALYVRHNGAWVVQTDSGALETVEKLGVNTVADMDNRLAVASSDILFSHNGGDCRVKLNKADIGDFASLLVQRGFSGRGEVSLLGDDSVAFRISSDGVSIFTKMSVAAQGVGFGVDEPLRPMHIEGTSAELVFGKSNGGASEPFTRFIATGNVFALQLGEDNFDAFCPAFRVERSGADIAAIKIGGNDRVYVGYAGEKVGLGATSQKTRLDVNGPVRGKT